jgi:hypothetical protein
MLRIKLTPPHLVNRKYVVFLDRDLRKSFTSKRKADDFVTRLENELNEALLFINEAFCNLTTFYRTYFLADRDFKFKYEVENHLDLINNRLSYISCHSGSENYNTMISHSLNVCFDALIEACQAIDAKSRQRYDMLTRRRIQLHKKVITQYRDSFEYFKVTAISSSVIKWSAA